MPVHDTLLCDESTQERSVECVDAGAAGAATAAGERVGRRGGGAGGVVERTDPPVRAVGVPLCGRTAARPVRSILTPKPAGRGRARYVPDGLVAAVRAWLARGEQVAAVIAEISAINAELLARRELR